MSSIDRGADAECSVCRQPFYSPENAYRADYRYTIRPVSDAHRVMYHSGHEGEINYDPEYFTAYDRLERARAARENAMYEHMMERRRKEDHDASS